MNTTSPSLEQALSRILDSLAPLLLDARVTPAAVAEAAKLSLVRAAAERSRMGSGRVNHSLVATLTGLTRVEVRRLLTTAPRRRRATSRTAIHADRAERVLVGWRTDRAFRDRDGRPRSLARRNGPDGFPDLVRRFSGDMPPAAVLRELQRIEAVRATRDTVALRLRRSGPAGRADHPLAEAAPQVEGLLRQLGRQATALTFAHRADLVVDDAASAMLLADRARQTLAAAVAALQPQAGAGGRARRAGIDARQPDPQCAVGITVIVTGPRRARGGSNR